MTKKDRLKYYDVKIKKISSEISLTTDQPPFLYISFLSKIIEQLSLGVDFDLYDRELLNTLKKEEEKPFALCLGAKNGWLQTAFAFADNEKSFETACRLLYAYLNKHLPNQPEVNIKRSEEDG